MLALHVAAADLATTRAELALTPKIVIAESAITPAAPARMRRTLMCSSWLCETVSCRHRRLRFLAGGVSGCAVRIERGRRGARRAKYAEHAHHARAAVL